MGWFAEYRRISAGQSDASGWQRLETGALRTQERAKAECKRLLEAQRHDGRWLEFRIVRNDERETVEQVSRPPHGWRMRWQPM